MGKKAAKPTAREGKPEARHARISAPPRLNVALSILDTVRVLPAFFGEAIGAFHLSRCVRKQAADKRNARAADGPPRATRVSRFGRAGASGRPRFSHE